MAIYRNVQMGFWTDVNVEADYTPEDKLFYLYLLTNPHTKLCGCYEISINQMSNEIGYKTDTIKRLLAKAQEKHTSVVYAETTKEILLVNWHKYNWTGSEKFRKALRQEILNVKCESFRKYLQNIFDGAECVEIPRYRIDTVSNPESTRMDTTVTVSVTDTVPLVDTVMTKAKAKDVKHRYGEYSNVLLTDKELEKLKTEFPSDWESRIENLSVYMQSKGTTYKDHLATIRNWARMEKSKQKKGSRLDVVDTWTLE